MNEITRFLLETVAGEIITASLGVVFGIWIRNMLFKWWHNGWHVKVMRDGEQLANRSISPRKKQEILSDEYDLAVFVKGFASTFAWINIDPVGKGRRNGFLTVDESTQIITIDLDKDEATQEKPTTSSN